MTKIANPIASVTKMMPAEWSLIKDNPRQRDTAKHAKKAKKRHMSGPASGTQAQVAAAVLPDGTTYKLDGHTRAYLWDSGELDPPLCVFVVVYAAANLDEVKELYTHFDSQAASETGAEKTQGAFREFGLVPQSTLIANGGVNYALRLVGGRNAADFDSYAAVGEWLDELLVIDGEMFCKARFPAALLAAMLITIRAHGDVAVRFWRAYHDQTGIRDGKESCGVDALDRLLISLRRRGAGGLSGGRTVAIDVASKAVAACENWIRGKTYTAGIRGLDLAGYVAKNKGKRTTAFPQQVVN